MAKPAPRPAIVPCVFYKDPLAAMDWLTRAFGFETTALVTDNQGRVGHAEMNFEGAPVGIGGEWESAELLGPAKMRSPASLAGAGSQFIRVHLNGGLEAHCEQARAAGAKITQEPADQFYGDRTYRALDPEGHVWNFAQTVKALSVGDLKKAAPELKWDKV